MASTSAHRWKASEAMGLPAAGEEQQANRWQHGAGSARQHCTRRAWRKRPGSKCRFGRPVWGPACLPATVHSPNVWRAMHCPVSASHSLTSWSKLPLASRLGLRGWKRTTQGVRRWPDSARTRRPVEQHVSFTVWSPLQAGRGRGQQSCERRQQALQGSSSGCTAGCVALQTCKGFGFSECIAHHQQASSALQHGT